MEIATYLWGKAAIYTILIKPPQELLKETSFVWQWIKLNIKKILLFLSELKLWSIGFGN